MSHGPGVAGEHALTTLFRSDAARTSRAFCDQSHCRHGAQPERTNLLRATDSTLHDIIFRFVAPAATSASLSLREAAGPKQHRRPGRSRRASRPLVSDRPGPLLGPALLRTGLAPFNASGSSKLPRPVDDGALRSAPCRGRVVRRSTHPGQWPRRLVCPLVLSWSSSSSPRLT